MELFYTKIKKRAAFLDGEGRPEGVRAAGEQHLVFF